MTIHASVKLVEAMRDGEPPVPNLEEHRARRYAHSHNETPYAFSTAACGAEVDDDATQLEWAAEGFAAERTAAPGTRRTSCPACLLLMRAATCPARWDHLETLGLAPKLEAK